MAASEGVTCVDDVGRLLEVLEAEILYFDREDLLPVARGLSRFLLHLQRADGPWNNFMGADGAINTSHSNNRAGLGWWAARGRRGLAWLVLRMAARSAGFAPALRIALRAVPSWVFQMSSGSCSTCPGQGKIWRNSRWAVALMRA